MVVKDLIPHQMGISKSQIGKLMKGGAINIPHSKMGSHAGDVVVMLKPQNARKLLSAYKRNKGMRLMMTPEELEMSMTHGQGFFKTLKKLTGINRSQVIKGAKSIGREAVRMGADAVGKAVSAYTGNPRYGDMVEKSLGKAGETLIKTEKVGKALKSLGRDAKRGAKTIALEAIDDLVDDLPAGVREVANEAVDRLQEQQRGQIYGNGLKKGSPEMKKKMAMLRAMRDAKKGEGIAKDFKKFGKKLSKGAKDLGRDISRVGRKIKEGAEDVGEDIRRGFKKEIIDSGVGKKIASTLIDVGADYVLPTALGATTAYFGGDPELGAYAGERAGDELQKLARRKGYGFEGPLKGRPRGRPRKYTGTGATDMSAPYKNALRLNYGIVSSNEVVSNEPISKFKTDPRVRPSSTEMTLSPYQSMSSPAMNPFVPTKYTQQGGTSCGYGGRGLYGYGLY